MGINTIEREGVSYSHPAHFILIGSMNPEEGELRPQLLDRFGLCVNIEGIDDPKARVEVIKRRQQFEENPSRCVAKWEDEEKKINELIVKAQGILSDVVLSDDILELIAMIAIDMQVDGHRADIFMMKTSQTIAAYHEQRQVTEEDVREAAEFVLPHRMRRKPFQDKKMENKQIEQTIEKHKREKNQPQPQPQPQPQDIQQQRENETQQEDKDREQQKSDANSETHFETGEPFKAKSLRLPIENEIKEGAGRRSVSISKDNRGRYIKYSLPKKEAADIAFDATFRAAAPYQSTREHKDTRAIIIEPQDIREKVRKKKVGNLVLFVVDSSGSMGANQRMTAAKGAILSLLINSYEKRDRVGMIAFKGEKAEVLLPPTNSVELASSCLSELPTGGKTPLSSGLQLALETIQRELTKDEYLAVFMVLITDGKANSSMQKNEKPFEEARQIACRIKELGIKSLVIDTETGFIQLGRLPELSEALNGRYYRLEDIKADGISDLVIEALRP